MSEAQPGHAHLLHQPSDDVTKFNGDVTGRDNQSASVISQATDGEFEHETADYQWLLDYELPCVRYRESYSREVGPTSLSSTGRDGSGRVSVLEASRGPLQDLSYETLARNLDANLAEIDMDDFHSEDIHNLLTLPTMCGEFQSAGDGEMFASVSGSMMNKIDLGASVSPHSSSHCDDEDEDGEYKEEEEEDEEEEEEEEEESCDRRDDEEYSGVSGDLSLYQSGPLFSPLKEPPPLANTTFSVDSLDCDSLHDDLILTCQANKDNYTIAFEGSFVQYSEDSDYHEAESESSGSNHWSTERLEGRTSAPAMTHSDQPYTTWSRVGRRASRTPEVPSRAATGQQQAAGATDTTRTSDQNQSSTKSNSMPNLMRRSLMRRSLEASGGCVKVFDLQNSMRSSQTSKTMAGETNNFSLVKLFMRQKSLSKEAVSLSSSISQEGACSSSDNQSNVHDSSDWPMNSQSENDMDGSASPVPPPALMRQNGVIYHHHHHHHHNHHQDRGFRRRTGSLGHDMTSRTNQQQDYSSPDHSTTTTSDTLTNNTANAQQQQQQQQQQDGLINNNNIITAANHPLDNTGLTLANTMDNVTSFEDSLKETNPCSKPPVTSPIREEPEGMDISMDSRGESKVLLDQSEKETKIMHEVLRLRDKLNTEKNLIPAKTSQKEKNNNRNNFNNLLGEEHKRSHSPGASKKAAAAVAAANNNNKREGSGGTSMRRRQDSGNSSSGYASNRGSTEKIRRPSDSDLTSVSQQKPRPKPRVMKQMSDQCLQTSNLKVSAMVNTSFNVEKKEVYVYYPNYALPDLGFLKDKKYNIDARVFLVPQHYSARPDEARRVAKDSKMRRPFSCGDMEKLKKHGFGHIKDWDSLNFLLPKELKEMLLDETECMETTKPSFCQSPKPVRRPASADYSLQQKCTHDIKASASASSLNSTQPSSGYRGSSTMLNDSEGESGNSDQKLTSRFDTPTDAEGMEKPPPLPKRSISLPVEERLDPEDPDTPPPRPPLPRGILRKSSSLKDDGGKGAANKRFSAIESGRGSMREDLLKRRSLQEPMEHMAHRVARDTIPEAAPASVPHEAEEEVNPNLPSPMGCSCVSQCTGFCGKGLQKKNLLRVSELPDVSSHEDLTEDDLLRIRSQVSNLLVARGSMGSLLADTGAPCELCPKKSVSFAEKNQCSDGGGPMGGEGAGTAEDETRPMVYDAHDKKTLVLSVRAAVEKLVTHFSAGGTQQEKVRLGTSAVTPTVAQLALDKLCPAVYALLSDGLHPSLQSLFGKINNSVWRVIEVTSQISPSTKALNDLVLTLNSEECLSEGPIKFNAFIFGLLNIRSLDSWLGYLRTRESVIQKHYHPEAFLYLANTATKSLYDDLLLSLRPLALLPFNLDLLHEYKALHASLQKMEERLLLHTGSKESPGDRPPSVLDHLHSKETKEFKNAAQQDRVKALMRVLASPELDEHELLHSTLDHSRDRSRSPRPRSCYDHVAGEELGPAQRKRWSGVQLGSRLLTAIDKLMLEEAAGTSSEDYTDSIDNPKSGRSSGLRRGSFGLNDDLHTDLRTSDVSSRDGDVSERSASEKDTENEKGARACVETDRDDEPEGVRFRRLQLKWEQMASPEKKPAKAQQQQQQQQPPQPPPQPQPPHPEKAISPSSGSRSRIPRPVSMTSPQRPFKAFDPSKEKTSPQLKQPPKYLPASPKELPKPAPRRSLKDKATCQSPAGEEQGGASNRPPSVRSRLAPRPTSITNNMVRASSVPGRVPASADKSSSPSGRYEGQRRYGGQPRSASHGRRVTPGDSPKLVQTLHHRLATDNGHLSFNRGDILTVVVEVDDRYLLCCHNDRKGLVPRASVIIHEE